MSSPWRILNMVPHVTNDDIQAVTNAMDAGYVAGGPPVTAFEEAFAAQVGARHAVATSSGTAALWLALDAMQLDDHDLVATADHTFMATAAPLLHRHCDAVLLDCDDRRWQMDHKLLDRTLGRHSTQVPDAVLLPHLWGGMASEEGVSGWCRRQGAFLVVDACQALGATLHGQAAGSWADVACWSFNGNKIITAGGGGMLTTNDGDVAGRARYMLDQAKDVPDRWVHHEAGWNFRMSAMQAALGRSQLARLQRHVEVKRDIAARYTKELGGVLQPRACASGEVPTEWAALYLVDGCAETLVHGLRQRGIEARRPFAPLSHQRPLVSSQLYLVQMRGDVEYLAGEALTITDNGPHYAEELYTGGVLLPCSVGLTKDDQQTVIEAVKELMP